MLGREYEQQLHQSTEGKIANLGMRLHGTRVTYRIGGSIVDAA